MYVTLCTIRTTRSSKLQSKWRPYYRVVEKKTPLTFIIRNQLDGTVTKAHLEHLRLANLDDWEIPKDTLGHKVRRPQYVVPPSKSEQSESEQSSSGNNEPLAKIARRYRRERDRSSEEEDIPLMVLVKRLKSREKGVVERSLISGSSSDSESDPESDPMEIGRVVRKTSSVKRKERLSDYSKLCRYMLQGFKNVS